MGWSKHANLHYAGRHRLSDGRPGTALPAVLILCAIVCPVLAACSVDGPDLLRYNLGPLQPLQGAMLVGTLDADGDCLFVVADDGTIWSVAWPNGRTTWDPARRLLRVGQDEAQVGDRIGVGGAGRNASDELVQSIDWAQSPKPECVGDRLWLAGAMTTDPSNFE